MGDIRLDAFDGALVDHVYRLRDPAPRGRALAYDGGDAGVDHAVQLDDVRPDVVRQIHDLVGVLKVSHEYDRYVWRDDGSERPRCVGCEGILRDVSNPADEADRVGAGRYARVHVALAAITAQLCPDASILRRQHRPIVEAVPVRDSDVT